MAKRKIIDVRRGGVLLPVGNNIYLAKGRTHEQGGIDIGDDLEIENNELAQVDGDSLKIFSAQPILNGYSPSQLVLGGANPDRVFNAQERFKDVNHLNDDGTRKKRNGGEEIGINETDAIQNYKRNIDNYEYDNKNYERYNKELEDKTGLAANIYRVLATIDPTGVVGTTDALARYINGDVGAATASLIGSLPLAGLIPRAGRLFNIKRINKSRPLQTLNRMDLIKEFRKEVDNGIDAAARRTRNYDRRGITYEELSKEKEYMELLNNNNKANNKVDNYNKILKGSQTGLRGAVQVYGLEQEDDRNKKKYGDRMKYIKRLMDLGGYDEVKSDNTYVARPRLLDERFINKNNNSNNNSNSKLIHNTKAIINNVLKKTGLINTDVNPQVINLSNENVSRINPNDKSNMILFNDFVEWNNPNNIRKAKDFKVTNDTLIGDNNIPLSKISQYYGVENGKLKVGDINIFDDNTTVVPKRNKRTDRVKSIINNVLTNEQIENYENIIDNEKENVKNQKIDLANRLMKEYNIEPTLIDKITNYFSDKKDYRNSVQNYGRGNRRNPTKEQKEVNTKYYSFTPKLSNEYINAINALKNKNRFVTEKGDTIQNDISRHGNKMFFADENGNSVFVNKLNELDKNQIDELNNILNKTPLYPVLVDNGRYSMYYTSPEQGDYEKYTSFDLQRGHDNIFVIGTKDKKFGGNHIDRMKYIKNMLKY